MTSLMENRVCNTAKAKLLILIGFESDSKFLRLIIQKER